MTPPSEIIGSKKAKGVVIVSVFNRMKENIINSFCRESKDQKTDMFCLYNSICDIVILRRKPAEKFMRFFSSFLPGK